MARGKTADPTQADYQARLREAADQTNAFLDLYEDEVEVRDRIILEALDAGCRRADVARWAGLTGARVTQVVARRAAEWA